MIVRHVLPTLEAATGLLAMVVWLEKLAGKKQHQHVTSVTSGRHTHEHIFVASKKVHMHTPYASPWLGNAFQDLGQMCESV